ncbi:MAG: sensor histidine kinase [Desulfobulbaceae bacterium]|nr:sensor histidine kinase [Desulfobulbaceae bacterium]
MPQFPGIDLIEADERIQVFFYRMDQGQTGCPQRYRQISLPARLRKGNCGFWYTSNNSTVTIRLTRSDGKVVIEVTDNGPGITDAEIEQTFSPFHRAATSIGTEGSGLGLAIAREASIQLGGSLSLHNQPKGNGLIYRYEQPIPIRAFP